jgi:peptidoglycan/LPS O-acetylase OafA/YrhL
MPLDRNSSTTPSEAVLAYRRDIDGIRGIAVAGVVIYHFFPEFLPSGFVGVDIFFVISGFLITSIIVEKKVRGQFGLIEFYERRVRRIMPALLVVLAAVIIFGWMVLLPHEWQGLGTEIVAGSLFSANLLYWSQIGYFDTESSRKILLHLWSLGVEEQFYIVWPLMFLVLSPRHYWKMAVATTVASFLACLVISHTASESAFFLPVTRWWELSLGALLCLAKSTPGLFNSQPRRDLASLAGLVLIAIALVALSASNYPSIKALLPTLGTALLIAAGDKALVNRTLLSARILVFVGLISFSLYLWHWPMKAYLEVIYEGDIPDALRVTALLAALVLSWLTWQFVEKRTRRVEARRIAPYLLLGLVLCAVAGASMAAGLFQSRLSTPEGERISRAVLDEVDKSQLVNASLRRVYSGDIVTWNPSGSRATLIIGDSLMAQLLPRINELSSQLASTDRQVILATRGGCLPVKEIRDYRKRSCELFVAEALKLADSDGVDTVAIGGRWYPKLQSEDILVESSSGVVSLSQGQALPQAVSFLESSLEAMRKKGKKVYLITSFPTSEKHDPATYASPCVRLGTCPLSLDDRVYSRRESKALTQKIDDALASAASQAGAMVLDPYDQLCSASDCNLQSDSSALIYRDAVHISEAYMRQSFKMLDPLLLGSDPSVHKEN